MIRRALPAVPVVLVVAFLGWGVAGALSAAYGTGLVLANFAVSALLLGWAGGRSLNLLMGVTLFGYLVRMVVLTAAVLAVRHQGWVELLPLGATIVLTHVGLLLWETRHVSASLAFPGLKPTAAHADGRW